MMLKLSILFGEKQRRNILDFLFLQIMNERLEREEVKGEREREREVTKMLLLYLC